MDKEEKITLDDVFNFDTHEGEEEVNSNKSVDEILQNNIEERNKSNDNDKEYISKYNKDNLLAQKDIKSEDIIDVPDLVEQLLEDSNGLDNNPTEFNMSSISKKRKRDDSKNVHNKKFA